MQHVIALYTGFGRVEYQEFHANSKSCAVKIHVKRTHLIKLSLKSHVNIQKLY